MRGAVSMVRLLLGSRLAKKRTSLSLSDWSAIKVSSSSSDEAQPASLK